MKFLPISILFLIAATKADNDQVSTVDIALFEEWIQEHGKEYSSPSEKDYRLKVWLENNQFIEDHNAKGLSWTCGHNQLSDLTHKEMIDYYQLYDNSSFSHIDESDPENNPWGLPIEDFVESSFEEFSSYAATSRRRLKGVGFQSDITFKDWVEDGAITPIKNQKSCGSCWAFSAMTSIEAAKFLKDGNLVSLAEQQLVDCDYYNNGCSGGFYTTAWRYLQENGGAVKESDYQYVWNVDDCKAADYDVVENTSPASWGFVGPRRNYTALFDLVKRMPIAVAVHASAQDFLLYKEGIYDGTCSTRINHGMNLVGFGEDEIPDGDCDNPDKKKKVLYWKLRNSWSHGWGEAGYMRIARDTSEGSVEGKCGMYKWPAWVGA